MNKPLKITLSFIAALFFLMLSFVMALPFLIDPNDFKPEIIAVVKQKTGRQLELTGDITLSIFPWLGVTTGQMVLNNVLGFQDRPFVTIEQSDIKVKLMPLLRKKIQVSRIVLKEVKLNLIKNKEGVANWDYGDSEGKEKIEQSAGTGNTSATPGTVVGASLASLIIDGIDLEHVDIVWENQQTNQHYELKELNLKTGTFTFNRPVDVDLYFKFGRAGAKPADSFKIVSKLNVADNFNYYQLSHFDLHYFAANEVAHLQPLTARLTAEEIDFDKSKQTIKLSSLRAELGDVQIAADLNGQGVIDRPNAQGTFSIAQFNPAKVMKQFNIPVPVMQDVNALNKLAANFQITAAEKSMEIRNLQCRLDDTLITGSIAIKDFAHPEIRFSLNADSINVDRYLAPEMKIKKPIASPAAALAAVFSKLPAATLNNLNAGGDFLVDTLRVNGLTMQGIHLKLNGKKGIVTTEQSITRLYQGSYSGNLSMDYRKGRIALAASEHIDQVQIAPLLKDYSGKARFSGVVRASAHVQAEGKSTKSVKSGLNGKFDFLIKEGAITGFNLQRMIDSGKVIATGAITDMSNGSDQTIFSEIKGTASLRDGVLHNNDLVAKSTAFRVEGKGFADLKTDSLDYEISAKLLKKKASLNEPESYHNTPVVIHVGGTFDSPTYKFDAAALLTDKNKAKLEKLLDKKKNTLEKFLDKLDKKLGPGSGELLKGIF